MTGKAASVLEQLSALSQVEQVEVVAASYKILSRPDVDVDVAPLRERFLVLHGREGLSFTAVAERLDWMYGKGVNGNPPKPDGTRVARRLGLAAENGGSGYWTVRRHISPVAAAAFCDALSLDYTEVPGV